MLVDLNQRFGIPGVACVIAGEGGLPKVVVSGQHARGEMYLHGGHVTSWIPAGVSEVLFCSPHSLWQDGRAIRGGVPICFPWFGNKADDPAAPAHGFVRTKAWELESIARAGNDVVVSMVTSDSADTQKWWPHQFRLTARATFGTQLKLKLTVTNTGATPFTFEEALHAYFRVGDAQTAVVQGLDGTDYFDKTDHRARKTQHGELRFAAETDSVFLDTQQPVELIDASLSRRIALQKENSLTTVVWNPWAEKARSLSDLGDAQWKNFICVETSNVGNYAVPLAPGHEHPMAVTVKVASL